MKPAKLFRRTLSPSRLLMAAVIAWIVLLAVIIVLDPRGAGPVH